jgi:hypothetical protein
VEKENKKIKKREGKKIRKRKGELKKGEMEKIYI